MGKAAKWLPWLVAVVLLAANASVLAKLTWRLVPAPPAPIYQDSATTRLSGKNSGSAGREEQPTSLRGASPSKLASHHLFGKADTAPKAVAKTPERTIKKTNLKLTLTGTFALDDPKMGIALIAANRNDEKAYSVGELVADSAELFEVYVDRVVLERNGSLEVLQLLREEATSSTANRSNNSSTNSSSRTQRTNNRSLLSNRSSTKSGASSGADMMGTDGKPDFRKIREELINNPEKVTDYIRVQPVQKDGAITGYRIYPGRNRDLFRKAGLRSGDLITAVNGQTLEDPNQGIAIIAALTTAERIDLTIQRRGRDRQLVVDLSQ